MCSTAGGGGLRTAFWQFLSYLDSFPILFVALQLPDLPRYLYHCYSNLLPIHIRYTP